MATLHQFPRLLCQALNDRTVGINSWLQSSVSGKQLFSRQLVFSVILIGCKPCLVSHPRVGFIGFCKVLIKTTLVSGDKKENLSTLHKSGHRPISFPETAIFLVSSRERKGDYRRASNQIVITVTLSMLTGLGRMRTTKLEPGFSGSGLHLERCAFVTNDQKHVVFEKDISWACDSYRLHYH